MATDSLSIGNKLRVDPTWPADHGVSVTPDDSNDLSFASRGVYVGGTGDLAVHLINNAGASASVTFVAVPAGTLLPIRATRVLSTGTSATSIVAVW